MKHASQYQNSTSPSGTLSDASSNGRAADNARLVARRWFLRDCGLGRGAIALGDLLRADASAATSSGGSSHPVLPHHAAKAKRVIFLFMAGAPSHLDLFDNKPQLAKFDGQLPPAELIRDYRAAFINPNSKLLGPKFKFARHGRGGAEVSELLPHLAEIVDDITIVRSLVTDAFNHAPAQILMNTGSQQFGRPSIGAWTLYGLGAESQNLPGFVVLNSGKKGPSGGNSNWGAGFLPTVYQRRGLPLERGGVAIPVDAVGRVPAVAARIARHARAAESHAARRGGRSRNRDADQCVRNGLPQCKPAHPS